MYYTEPFKPTTNTAKFGIGILHNMDISLFNVDCNYPTDIDELIILKNNMKEYVIFDGRNQYDPSILKEMDIDYIGIGRTNIII